MNAGNSAPDSEPELIHRARLGDREAFATLYRRHARTVYALALRLTGNPAHAEEVLQDVFLRAWQRLGQFRGEAGLRPWLRQMAAHGAIDRLRQQRPEVEFDPACHAPPDPASAESGVEALGLLARLAAPVRAVLWLHEMEGYSHPEIATLFGRSASWSKSLLARGLQRLREELAPGCEELPDVQRR